MKHKRRRRLLIKTALAGIFAAGAIAAGCNTAELYVPPPDPVEELPDSSIDRFAPLDVADPGETSTPEDATPDTTQEDPDSTTDSSTEMDASDAKTDAKDAISDAKKDG